MERREQSSRRKKARSFKILTLNNNENALFFVITITINIYILFYKKKLI